jgi:DNA-binding MurR/RpiR family transcriptional regulator
MGFADISITELAADYQVSPEEVARLCSKLGIPYRSMATRLPLEDTKTIILALTAPEDDKAPPS